MYRQHRIAVVMPAFNVEAHVAQAVQNVPAFVDEIIVVNDASFDRTALVLHRARRAGLTVLNHDYNRGVGAAIATGYREALRRRADFIVVMAGDGQMNPDELPALLNPLVEGRADYVKGNRFRQPGVWRVMPKKRFVGNVLLSLLTKVTSGYWKLFDSQCGYTAISATMLHRLQCQLYPRYGYLNDFLARLKAARARVSEVPVSAIYDGQPSGINLSTVFYPILFVLGRSMIRRIWQQHLQPTPPQPQIDLS